MESPIVYFSVSVVFLSQQAGDCKGRPYRHCLGCPQRQPNSTPRRMWWRGEPGGLCSFRQVEHRREGRPCGWGCCLGLERVDDATCHLRKR